MEHDWILDVLSDLRSYADQNGLPKLAEQLNETTLLAALEISSPGDVPEVDGDRPFQTDGRSLFSKLLSAPVAG